LPAGDDTRGSEGVAVASIQRRPNGKWRARFRDPTGREHARHFTRKVDAQRWLDQVTADLQTGRYVDPKSARMTVDEWCDRWLEGYRSRRPSTVKTATVHLGQIRAEFGSMRLAAVRPSHVKAWVSRLLAEGHARGYVNALHARLAQIMDDAVADGILAASPCSRRTSPGPTPSRPYVATTEQVWALYDAFTDRYQLAVLLGAFAGLRVGEVCGLRVEDVDFLGRVITPAVQFPAAPLKTAMGSGPIPVPRRLINAIARLVERWPGPTVLTGPDGGQVNPWVIQHEMRRARAVVPGLPEGFRFHDLRHYYASLLIASGADVK